MGIREKCVLRDLCRVKHFFVPSEIVVVFIQLTSEAIIKFVFGLLMKFYMKSIKYNFYSNLDNIPAVSFKIWQLWLLIDIFQNYINLIILFEYHYIGKRTFFGLQIQKYSCDRIQCLFRVLWCYFLVHISKIKKHRIDFFSQMLM